tara:strand:+ start:49 stop:570 length:522 start_codon:yes stop_codon:yes gene_type:complete
MKKNILKKLFEKLVILTLVFISTSACSKKETTDNFDFSNFKPPNRKAEIVKDNSDVIQEIKVKNELLPFEKSNEISSSIKYGKEDPFAIASNSNNNSLLNLILKGFITTSEENYALINYLGEEGTITKNSVGGVNTKYLPNGAIVKKFNLTDLEMTILLGDKELIISINDQLK